MFAPLLIVTTLTAVPALSTPPLLEADVPLKTFARVGISVDAGLPEGIGAELTVRPFSWLSLQLGAASNGAAAGVRGGVVFAPLRTFLRPTLSVHAGHFVEGDGNHVVRFFGGDDAFSSPLLSRLRYDYASAHLGVELGPPNGTSVFIRGGMSRVLLRLGGFEEAARQALADDSLTARAPTITLHAPSLQLGLTVFIH